MEVNFLIILVAWEVWKHRDARAFEKKRPTACSFGWWLMAGAGLF
jgi:hypothetical protein